MSGIGTKRPSRPDTLKFEDLAKSNFIHAKLLKARDFIEQAPLFCNAPVRAPEDRYFVDLNSPPCRIHAQVWSQVRARGYVSRGNSVTTAEHIYYSLVPVRKRRTRPLQSKPQRLYSEPKRNLGTSWPMAHEVRCIDLLDHSEVPGAPYLVQCFD